MTDKSKDVTVGARVRVTVSDSDADGTRTCVGVVIEDYADMVIDRGSVGRDWAPVYRWAIALDDGGWSSQITKILRPQTRSISASSSRSSIAGSVRDF